MSEGSSETARLAALYRHRILDTEPEQDYDDLTFLASRICNTPIALISLIDSDRQWFKSRHGLTATETSRTVALCAHAIEQRGLFVVPDTLADERFNRNPLVTGAPNIRFYAGAPLVTPDGHALGTLCVIDQVTRTLTAAQMEALWALKRQAEALLAMRLSLAAAHSLTIQVQQSEDRVRRILDSSLDAVVAMNGLGRITFWTAQAEATFGWTAEEATGRTLGELIVPSRLREAHDRGLRHYVETGEGTVLNRRLELAASHKDGHEFPVELAIAATTPWTPSTSPEDMLFSAFVRDTSDRKRTEEDLRRAKEEAESAARAKSEFLAVMSHEVRTPLNAVIGMLNRVLEMSPTAQQRVAIAVAQSSAESLLAITNDILDFSRISAGRLLIEETAFDLDHTIEDVAAALRPQAKPGHVDLRVRFPKGRPGGVIGDPGRLRQILYNLVGNALKFTREGYVEITCHAQPPGADGAAVHRIAVEDTGVGIPADRQTSIFEAFTQADASTTRRFGGSGLGLSICAQLATLMSGSVRLVRSSPAGSVFELVVPFRPTAFVSGRDHYAGSPRSFTGRLLLVEDNPVNQQIALGMLRATGCTVDVAGNGVEAIEMVRRFRYDLIFMDCRMPEMDGYEATRAIRKLGLPTTATLPIVAMTASALPEDRQRCLEAGMDGHLSKPIVRKAVEEALERWLVNSTPQSEPVSQAGAAPQSSGKEPSAHDQELLSRRRARLGGDSPAGWETLCRAFLEHGRATVERLKQLAADRDFPELRNQAHDLRGSAGMIGASELSRLCGRLEEEGPDPETCDGLVAAVQHEFARVSDWLNDDRP